MRYGEMETSEKLNLLRVKLAKSLHQVLSIDQQIMVIEEVDVETHFDYGVEIKISGDVNGKLVISAKVLVFQLLSDKLFGWKLSDWMLHSFTGEIVNMIAGYFSTEISRESISTYLKEPKIIENERVVMRHSIRIRLKSEIDGIGPLDVYLLLD